MHFPKCRTFSLNTTSGTPLVGGRREIFVFLRAASMFSSFVSQQSEQWPKRLNQQKPARTRVSYRQTLFSIGGIVQTFFFFGSRRRDDDITWRRDHWWTPECTYSSFSLQLLSCLMFCCFFQKFSFDDTQLAFGFVKCLWTFYFLDRWITVCLRVFLSDEEIVLDLSVEPVDG